MQYLCLSNYCAELELKAIISMHVSIVLVLVKLQQHFMLQNSCVCVDVFVCVCESGDVWVHLFWLTLTLLQYDVYRQLRYTQLKELYTYQSVKDTICFSYLTIFSRMREHLIFIIRET